MQRSRSTATIEDVGRLAKVHPSTASRVLRGVPTQSVSPATRERILQAARALEYRPNALARGLRLKQTRTVALLSPYLESLGFSEIARGIQEGATENGFALLTAVVDGINGEDLYRQLVGEGRVDGIIAAFGLMTDPLTTELAQSGVPLVAVNRRVKGVPASVVVQDDRASRLSVEHLVGLGHRRLGHISGETGTDTAMRREKGFREACSDLGVTVSRGAVESGGYSVEGGYRAAEAIMSLPAHLRPTGLVIADPQSALGAMKYLREAGIGVPDAVSLVSLNDHMVAEHVQPALTAVKLPFREMGREAARMLSELIDGQPPRSVIVEEPAPELIVRGSTAPPAA